MDHDLHHLVEFTISVHIQNVYTKLNLHKLYVCFLKLDT